MRCSCPPPLRTLLLLLLLAPLLRAAPASACPVLGAAPPPDPQTKAYLAPLVFHGTLTAIARRGPALRASFRVDRTLKGMVPPSDGVVAEVEFALRENPARCRGAALPLGKELALQRRYVVFAAYRRRKLIAVAAPEDYSRRKAVARVLCDKCGE